MNTRIELRLADHEIREALKEWVEKHTPFKVAQYAWVEDRQGKKLGDSGTVGLGCPVLLVEPRDK